MAVEAPVELFDREELSEIPLVPVERVRDLLERLCSPRLEWRSSSDS